MVGVEHLTKAIHPSQLTAEFEGTLPYDNEEWIELRLVLFSFYFYTSIHRVIFQGFLSFFVIKNLSGC